MQPPIINVLPPIINRKRVDWKSIKYNIQKDISFLTLLIDLDNGLPLIKYFFINRVMLS